MWMIQLAILLKSERCIVVSRETFLKKTTSHAKEDEFIGLSNYKERVTAVVYRGPYLDPKKFDSGSVPICSGEISSGLDTEVVLIDRELSKRVQIHIEPNRGASGSALTEKEVRKRTLTLVKSLLSQSEQNAVNSLISKIIDKDADALVDVLSVNIGYWAYVNTYKLPKSMMGSHSIDFKKSPSPTILLDKSIARSRGPKSVSNISVVAILYNNTHDIRGTDIVPSGVSAYIKDADVSDTNSLSKNIQNGINAVLNDDCNKRTIQLRKIDAGTRSLK